MRTTSLKQFVAEVQYNEISAVVFHPCRVMSSGKREIA